MSTDGYFVKQCTKCGATILSGFSNCPWCGVERKREVFKTPASVSNDWLLTEDEMESIHDEWEKGKYKGDLTWGLVPKAQLRKVAERIKSRRDPLSPEYTGGVIEIILNQDEYHALLQEAGLEARE